MKVRNVFGLMFSVILLLVAAGSGPVRGAQPTAHPAPAGANADPAANAPWFIETVDSGSGVGSHVSVAIDDSGTTYISYYDATNKDLKVAKYVGSGGNCGPDNDWSCETVDSSSDVGKFSSIAIDPTTNLPVIAYWYMVFPYKIKLATAWSGGWDTITVDDSHGYISLKIDSTGAAHISYSSSDKLKYAKRVGSGGNCGGNNYQCDSIDVCSGSCLYSSLALDGSGQPRIAYYETNDDDLWFAQPAETSGNCGPGNSWGCYQVDSASDVGRYASLDVDSNNIPHIAYYDATNGKLRYAVYVGADGNCGFLSSWQCDEIAKIGGLPNTRPMSLAVDKAGFPIIAYQDNYWTGFGIKSFDWARPAAALGLQSGNCDLNTAWQCEGIDGPWTGAYSAIAVNPSSGLATIAYNYSKFVFDPSELRVAYQRFHQVFLPLVTRNQ